MDKKPKNPVKYTPELGQKICDIVSISPYGLNKLCEMHEFLPIPNTIYEWRRKYPDFGEQYARAKLEQADILIDDILNIARSSTKDDWQQARFLVDTHKWIASKLLPKKYGDKYVVDHKSEDEDSEANKEMLKLRAELDAKNKKDY
jgi:hypothetical protein